MKKLCSVDLIPAKKDKEYLGKIIHSLSQQYNTLPFDPHVTIYGNLEIELSTLNAIISPISTSIEPFTIHIKGIGYSEKRSKTLFFDMLNNQVMIDLFLKLNQQLSSYGIYTFSPHLSLIYKENLQENQKKDLANEIEIIPEILVDRYSIVSVENSWDDISQWKTVKEEMLGK